MLYYKVIQAADGFPVGLNTKAKFIANELYTEKELKRLGTMERTKNRHTIPVHIPKNSTYKYFGVRFVKTPTQTKAKLC